MSPRPQITLAWLIAAGAATYTGYSGSRVAASLMAIELGYGAAAVGLLHATYALLPIVLSIPIGRAMDRLGLRVPMAAGVATMTAGLLIPVATGSMPALYVACAITGAGQAAMMIGINTAVGAIAPSAERANWFAWMSVGMLGGMFAGPLVAGFGLEHGGRAVSFAILAGAGALAVAMFLSPRLVRPATPRAGTSGPRGGIRSLLAAPGLVPVLVISTLIGGCADVFQVLMPVYGTRIGLSASRIGMVISSFAVGNAAIRIAMPVFSRRFREWSLIMTTVTALGLSFVAMPFAKDAAVLMGIAFVLGAAFGFGFPSIMALIYTLTPDGRQGEVVGLRVSLQNANHIVVPAASGFAGAAVGIAPVITAVGAAMLAVAFWARSREPRAAARR